MDHPIPCMSHKYLIQTHSQTKDSGIKLPEVHGAEKGVDPNLRPEMDSEKISEISREV